MNERLVRIQIVTQLFTSIVTSRHYCDRFESEVSADGGDFEAWAIAEARRLAAKIAKETK